MKSSGKKLKGRGSATQFDNRYLSEHYEDIDDGWSQAEEQQPSVKTRVTVEKAKTIITRNQSPDIPFTQSINPYRGCEHGCSYCYARPAHAYVDLSPGIDFETKLFAKPNAAELLKNALAKTGYQCSPIALGSNTDPYQPIERQWKITRQIIQVLKDHDHPLTIVTKSNLVERDIDLLAPMAEKNLVQVFISITSLNNALARKLEPRATAPHSRLKALANLQQHQIPTGVMFAPVIPVINDTEMETVLVKSAETGVTNAGYVMLRLPQEVRPIFKEWLQLHEPLKAEHVMSMVRDIRNGQENDSEFGRRQRGQGNYADIIAQRFAVACRKFDLNTRNVKLDCSIFKKPVKDSKQMSLFSMD